MAERAADTLPGRTDVPFRVLAPVNEPVEGAILADLRAMVEAEEFVNGPQVQAFEHAFADYCGVRACAGVGSGIDAIRLGLLAAGLEPGDEVVVPANSFIATYAAIRQAGAVPVLVDVSERDYNVDVAAAAAAVTGRTRFLLPVHLYGQMADMRALRSLAEERSLLVLEDAAQAHGAERDGLHAGGAGLAAAFSFWPGKNLGAWGDAGALTTDDSELARRVRALREHGQLVKREYAFEGYTSRLDTIQAIVLFHKLPLLDAWNEERRAVAAFYGEALAGVGDLVLPPVPPGSSPVWHLYPLLTDHRAEVVEVFDERGIRTGRHAPQPAHLSAAFAWLGRGRGEFPLTERLAARSLLLPIFPGLREAQLEAVVDAVVASFRGR